MKELAHGTVFAVPLPDGTFLCGRVMLDIYGCLRGRLFPDDSPLPGLGKAYLIEMYSAVVPSPKYTSSPLLIPGAFVESQEVGRTWPVIGHRPVDPRTVEFPESLVIFMHKGGEVAFECGEIRVPIPLSYHDLQDRISVRKCRHSAHLWPYICLRMMDRDKEVPVEYTTATLSDNDLRFSPYRKEVYEHLLLSMAEPYFQMQAQMGLHLERLYE